MRRALIATAVAIVAIVVVLPLVFIFAQAFRDGWHTYLDAIRDAETLRAVWLTVVVTTLAVPFNVLFGLAAAWAITKFQFFGKSALIAFLDVPFAVSPVIVGLVFILALGKNSLLGGWLAERGVDVIFALPGMVLVTMFVTLPFVARELIPLMQASGAAEEEAAVMLGASGWQTFWHVTIPNIKWGLLYGTLLSVARAVGEFGAASVVSGHIRGRTTTVPLHVEILYNDYNVSAAFAVASLLTVVAIVTLIAKHILGARIQ